jgi:hypothetical protein
MAESAPMELKGLSKKKQHDELIAMVKKWYDTCKSARGKQEAQWSLNLSFYFGKQNVVQRLVPTTSGTSTKLWVPPAPYWRSRPVVNKVKPIIRTELSKTTSSRPTVNVVPASSDDSDLFAAQAGEQIWDSIYRRKTLRRILRRTMFWTLTCGVGFMKDWWDETEIDTDSNQMGDICISPENPYNIYVPDLLSEDIEDQPYVLHCSAKTVDWVKMRYQKDLAGRDVKPNVKSISDVLDNSFLNLITNQNEKPDSILCTEVWIKPGCITSFPTGGVLTIIGDQIVSGYEGWPYLHGEYPFIKFDHIATGAFYADSVINDLISPQREYNRTRGQIIESKNRTSKPQLMAPMGSVDPNKITTEPGQVILYKAGFQPPQPLPLQNLPPYVLDELDRLQMEFDDISGQHEVTKGRVPPGVTAGTAINFLQEQDDSKLAGTIDSIEEGMEKLGHHVLSYVVQYWDTPRMIKTTGADGSFDAMMLKGADLRGNTDVQVEAGSALPNSKAAKQSFVMDLMKMGFINPSEGLEVMEIGGITKLYQSVRLDVRQAQRENLMLQRVTPDMLMQHYQEFAGQQVQGATGEEMGGEEEQIPAEPPPIVPVNTWDEHQTHIAIHNRFRKSQSFEILPDFTKAMFEEHVKMHMDMMSMQFMGGAQQPDFTEQSQAEPNAVQPGAGPPPPGATGGP